MNAISSEVEDLQYSSLSPVLVAASREAAMRRAERTVGGNGLRIGARLPIESALARIKEQPAAMAVWVELDRDCGDRMDELLGQLSRDVSQGLYSAIISATSSLLDPINARVGDTEVEMVVDADEVERAAALAVAIARRGSPLRLSDIGSDRSADRLRQLSEEVSRIASTLARLSDGPSTQRPSIVHPPSGESQPLSADIVRNVIRARRLRSRYFAEELFADPAWDMLLDLLQAEIAQLRVPVSSLCIAAAVPATTALRWLKTMVVQGLFIRRADPHDGRRVFVELAPDASNALRRYFADLGPAAVI